MFGINFIYALQNRIEYVCLEGDGRITLRCVRDVGCELQWEVDGTDSGVCPMAGFGICGVECSTSACSVISD
jgi:hypothetical protein